MYTLGIITVYEWTLRETRRWHVGRSLQVKHDLVSRVYLYESAVAHHFCLRRNIPRVYCMLLPVTGFCKYSYRGYVWRHETTVPDLTTHGVLYWASAGRSLEAGSRRVHGRQSVKWSGVVCVVATEFCTILPDPVPCLCQKIAAYTNNNQVTS